MDDQDTARADATQTTDDAIDYERAKFVWQIHELMWKDWLEWAEQEADRRAAQRGIL